MAQADFLLSQAFTAYVRDLRSSGSSGTIFIDRELKPAVPQARELLQAAASAPSLNTYIAEMGWMHPIYGQIRRAFANQGGYFGQGGAERAGPHQLGTRPGFAGRLWAALHRRRCRGGAAVHV